jgi:hypothetical protein
MAASHDSAPFSERQKRFPVLKDTRAFEDPFGGAKRAFVSGHRHAGAIAAKVNDSNWRTESRAHEWAYRQEFAIVMAKYKVCDDETLRRANRAHPKPSEAFVPLTTGPRPLKALPPEVQDTQYPRYHRVYFGA